MSEIIELDGRLDSPPADLLMALKNEDFEEFKRILESIGIKEFCTSNCACKVAININYLYNDPENKTLLDIACGSANKAAFVKCLLQHGADVNLINCTHGAAPIHLAVLNSDFETVKLLVEHNDINIYQPNSAGLNAFQLAAQCKRKDFIKLLQGRQAFEIERAKIKVRKGKPGLERYRYIDYDETNSLQMPKTSESSESDESLSSLLRNENFEAFKSKANADNVRHIDDTLGLTYLQYACEFGMTEFVELLLDLNVDPNQTGGYPITPITLAAYGGYYDIVQLLQNTGIIAYHLYHGNNILHYIMYGYIQLRNLPAEEGLASIEQLHPVNLDNVGRKDHIKCLKLILNNVPDNQLDVNMLDSQGFTPLYYAILSDNRDMILALIERGGYVGEKTPHGRLMLQYMKPTTLEYFLDESMSTITPSADEYYYDEKMWPTILYRHFEGAVFNYNWLTCSTQHSKRKQINETKLLKALSEVPELRPLLKHPLIMVLLECKWNIIAKKLFYIDLSIYIQFVFFLSIYLLIPSENPEILLHLSAVFFWYSVFIGNTIMLLKEFAQLIIYSKANKYKYVSDPKNYMEITLITIVYVILFGKFSPAHQMRAILAAIAILISYVELILLVLNHPTMSIQIAMFKVVASNTFKVLMSYVILILAFAFTFFLLLKDKKQTVKSGNETKEESDKSFGKIYKAIFKTLIMSTGEYEMTNILHKDHNYGVSHLVFILFTFFIPIVLFNLLNAVAVSDIQAIRKKAELISIVARVNLIAHVEEVIPVSFSLLPLLFQSSNHFISNAMRRRLSSVGRCDYTQERQYYSTNNFGAISNRREIIYRAQFKECCIIETNFSRKLKFVISPSTEQSIREKLSPETSQEEKFDGHYKSANFTQENATLQEVCKSLISLKNSLEKTDEKYPIVEQILTKITMLSNQKSK